MKLRRIAEAAFEVIDTPEFRDWYDRNRCEGAPDLDHFLRYARRSLPYDVPGQELAGLVYEATGRAFDGFDAERGNQGRGVGGRFLTHWRFHLANLARSLREERVHMEELPDDLVDGRDGPHDECLKRGIRDAVEGLGEEAGLIVEEKYLNGQPFSEIAKKLQRRKEDVIELHDEILEQLRRAA